MVFFGRELARCFESKYKLDMPEANEEEEVDVKKPFENLDLRGISVFGGKKKAGEGKPAWSELAKQSKTLGWQNIDRLALAESLARAVDATYFRIVSFKAEDLDTEITWHASFLNDRGLWKLEIFNSPRAEVEPEQCRGFFGSASFKKIAKKASWILEESRKLLEDVLNVHLDDGELLEVDEVKLAALMHWLSDKQWMENLRTGKFMEEA